MKAILIALLSMSLTACLIRPAGVYRTEPRGERREERREERHEEHEEHEHHGDRDGDRH